jgi:hypothetical protein
VVVALSIGFAPERGLVWSLWQQWHDRRRFAVQVVRRDLYRYAQAHGGTHTTIPHAFIVGVRQREGVLGLRQLQAQGEVERLADGWRLTEAGVQVARQDDENQRLWELYRQYGETLALPVVPEDRQRDIHTVLPEPAIEKLSLYLKGAVAS